MGNFRTISGGRPIVGVFRIIGFAGVIGFFVYKTIEFIQSAPEKENQIS